MESDLKKVFIDTIEDLRNWLAENYAQKDSVWLVRFKKDFANKYIDYADVVDELLCYGWVDSLPKKLDEKRTMLRISPRNPRSNWSGINKQKVRKLTAQSRMQPPGLELVTIAKENGSWNFLDEVEQLVIPEDLQTELEKVSKANYYFNRFPDSSKRGILEWIKSAKTVKTRKKRIADTAEKASLNKKANQPKGRDNGPKE
jgi:uncharacterized protein YdeI (YjbR/CyaY-like superfamily)